MFTKTYYIYIIYLVYYNVLCYIIVAYMFFIVCVCDFRVSLVLWIILLYQSLGGKQVDGLPSGRHWSWRYYRKTETPFDILKWELPLKSLRNMSYWHKFPGSPDFEYQGPIQKQLNRYLQSDAPDHVLYVLSLAVRQKVRGYYRAMGNLDSHCSSHSCETGWSSGPCACVQY